MEKKEKTVKISSNIEVFYCKKRKIVIFKGPLNNSKSLKLHNQLEICYIKQKVVLANKNTKKCSNSEKKKIYTVKRTTISLIKQLLTETTALTYQKLKLVGVGYRVFPVENFEDQLVLLKLGYSHPIYFKIMPKTKIFCFKLTKLFIYGFSYKQITLTAAKIRLNKIPEPYKGKGILYESENIVLKEGKKI